MRRKDTAFAAYFTLRPCFNLLYEFKLTVLKSACFFYFCKQIMQELLKTLFKTFIISIVLTIAINSMYYAVSKQNEDYGHVIPLIISGALFLNVMLLVMALPWTATRS